MKMFGGIIDWKDCKEKAATMSTTEAELLSLSNGGREVCWWMRIFLLTKVDPELKTMLRQKVQQGNIHISWKPMSEMRHDKCPALKHQEFIKVFGLREMIR
jgi:hypothetical protein